jgi:tripartite-type tricarboxylate transporter receptor subunit TctC
LAPSFATEPLYDPLKEFTPISMHGRSSMMLVVPPSLGVNSVAELIALASSKPGQLNYAGTLGGANYVVTERFKQLARIDLRLVSYKGEGPALPDVVAGHVQVLFAFNSVAVPLVKAGKLKALVVTGDKPVPALPDVPTVVQAGLPELLFTAWGGFFAPRGTPRAIIDQLNPVIVRAIADPDIQKVARDAGAEPVSSTPEECAQLLKADLAKWGPVITATGVRL